MQMRFCPFAPEIREWAIVPRFRGGRPKVLADEVLDLTKGDFRGCLRQALDVSKAKFATLSNQE